MGARQDGGALVARRINDTARPFAVISPNGQFGEEIVAGYMTESDANLFAAAPDMLAALKALLNACVRQDEDEDGSILVMALYSAAKDKAAAAIARAEARADRPPHNCEAEHDPSCPVCATREAR